MQSYLSKFESVWMTLTDSTVTQRQAHGTICAGGATVVCNTHASDVTATQEAIGTALYSPEVIDGIWNNQCSLKASESGGEQLAAKVGCSPHLVRP